MLGREFTTVFTARSAGAQRWLYGAAPIVRLEEVSGAPEPGRSTHNGNLFKLHEQHRRGPALERSDTVRYELVTRAAPSRPSVPG
jgi:hypothetical protein